MCEKESAEGYRCIWSKAERIGNRGVIGLGYGCLGLFIGRGCRIIHDNQDIEIGILNSMVLFGSSAERNGA